MTPCSVSACIPSTKQLHSGRQRVTSCSELALASSCHTATRGLLSSVYRPRRMFSPVTSSLSSHMLAPTVSAASSEVLATATGCSCAELVHTHSVSAVCSTEAPWSAHSGTGEQTAARYRCERCKRCEGGLTGGTAAPGGSLGRCAAPASPGQRTAAPAPAATLSSHQKVCSKKVLCHKWPSN